MPRGHTGVSSDYHGDGSAEEDAFMMECEASYLSVLPSKNTPIDSRKQLRKALQQAGRNPSEKQINEIWTDGNMNVITYAEYCNVLREMNLPSRDDLLNAFNRLDLNNDGFLSHQELSKALTLKGEKMTQAEVKKIITEADVNKDGKLDYKEFCTLMLSTSQRCQQKNFKNLQIFRAERKSNSAKPVSASSVHPVSPGHRKPSLLRDVSNEDSQVGLSKKGLKPVSRPTSAKTSVIENKVKIKQPAVFWKKSNITVPKSLKTWHHVRSKGCFYLDNDDGATLCHHFVLELPAASKIWLTIKPYYLPQQEDIISYPIDTCMLILRKSSSDPKSSEIIGMTSLWENSCYCWEGDLRSGSYLLIPFTSGCRLIRRRNEPVEEIQLVRKDQTNRIQLSKAFRETLCNIFEMCDLDENGLLNRQEFSWFQLLTSDEEVDDEAWRIVQENFEMKKGELTREGFIELHLMQAREENADASEELMDTLLCMGYNKALDLDQACPFEVDVHAADCNAEMYILTLSMRHQHMETQKLIVQSIMQFGEKQVLKNLNEVEWYIYKDSARVSSVLENKSKSTVELNIECEGMKNCVTTKRRQNYTLRLVPNSHMLVDHVMPKDEKQEWTFFCMISKQDMSAASTLSLNSSSTRPKAKKSSMLSLF